jgi:hypothetical protein
MVPTDFFVRNEWQDVSIVYDNSTAEVQLLSSNCFARQTNDAVMLMLAFEFEVMAAAPLEAVDFTIAAPVSVHPVKHANITVHTDTGGQDTRFSHTLLQHTGSLLSCRAFPLLPHRRYSVNTQYFYRCT